MGTRRQTDSLLVLGCVVFVAIVACPPLVKANFSGSDDFSTPSAAWGADSAGGAGHFELQEGKLNFVTVAAPTVNDTVQRAWIANVGDYTADWSVRVDMGLGNFAMTPDQYASMTIVVDNPADAPNDLVRATLRRDGVSNRYFYADSISNGLSLDAIFVPTLATEATLGLSYDSATRTITAGYDPNGLVGGFTFHRILSVPIEQGLSDWNMNASDTFRVRLVSQTQFMNVSLGQMALDNFVASGEQLLIVPEPVFTVLNPGLLAWLVLCRSRTAVRARENI